MLEYFTTSGRATETSLKVPHQLPAEHSMQTTARIASLLQHQPISTGSATLQGPLGMP
jgi:hypothetical protein